MNILNINKSVFVPSKIFINDNLHVIAQYIIPPNPPPGGPPPTPFQLAEMYFGCVVFIETFPDGEIPVESAKGVRKTWLEGYSTVNEFYSPDYSVLPTESHDYRRTLYWNPMVTPDENGKAHVSFYNNSRCTNFNISAETVTSQGMIGVYKNR